MGRVVRLDSMTDKFSEKKFKKFIDTGLANLADAAKQQQRKILDEELEKAVEKTHEAHHELFERIAKSEERDKEAARIREYYGTEKGKKVEHARRRKLRNRWSKARYDAGRRASGAKEFSITFEEYADLMQQHCHYCNQSLAEETGSGMDRMDNELGYTSANVVQCCSDCNRRRSKSMSSSEFLRQTILNGRRKD